MAWGAVMRPMLLVYKSETDRNAFQESVNTYGRQFLHSKREKSEHMFRLSPLATFFLLF